MDLEPVRVRGHVRDVGRESFALGDLGELTRAAAGAVGGTGGSKSAPVRRVEMPGPRPVRENSLEVVLLRARDLEEGRILSDDGVARVSQAAGEEGKEGRERWRLARAQLHSLSRPKAAAGGRNDDSLSRGQQTSHWRHLDYTGRRRTCIDRARDASKGRKGGVW